MKKFFRKYGLTIPAILWATLCACLVLFGANMESEQLIEIVILAASSSCSAILCIIARKTAKKPIAIFAAAVACIAGICMLMTGDSFSGLEYLIHAVVMLLLALNMIPVFRSEKKKVTQAASNASDNQQVAQMQEQLEQMRAEMERMKAGQTEKVTEPIQTAQVEEAAPSASAEVRPEAVAVPQMPDVEKKPVGSAQNTTTAQFSFNGKWIVAAVVSLLFIFFSTRAYAFVSIDAYVQKCIAIAAVWCIATRKRRGGIVLAIVYAAMSTLGFLDTLASVSYRASLLDTGVKLLLYFKTLGSLIAVAPILYFAFVPRRGKGLLKALCGITVAVFAAEIAINLFALGSVSSLIPCTALNYAFCAAAAFAVGESANIEKKEKQENASSHSLFKKAFAYFKKAFAYFKDEEKVENLGERSKVVAALLAWFLGAFGAHRYYLGYKKRGMLMSIGAGCLVLGTILMTISATGATMGAVNAALSRESSGGFGFAVLSVLSIPLLLAGAATGIMALVDFIQILMNKLLPADGKPYQNGVVVVQSTANNPNNSIEALEKLAKLHEQGILTDEEFQQKKTEILGKM